MKQIILALLTSLLLPALLPQVGLTLPVKPSPAVGTVDCGSGRGGEDRKATLLFAALSPGPTGYDLLLVDQQITAVLSLDSKLVVQAASSLQGQQLLPWNLVAYDRQPLQLSKDGKFSLGMMVSTRSACRFQGTVQFLQGADRTLFQTP